MRPIEHETDERRRDRRLTMTGQAVLRTLHGASEFHGGLEDVSAGGLRFRLRPGEFPEAGAFGAVDVRVVPGGGPGEAASVRLTGFAEVVRIEEEVNGSAGVAIRFLDPLRVRDAFEPEPPLAAWR
jgi:hypothetical protein